MAGGLSTFASCDRVREQPCALRALGREEVVGALVAASQACQSALLRGFSLGEVHLHFHHPWSCRCPLMHLLGREAELHLCLTASGALVVAI